MQFTTFVITDRKNRPIYIGTTSKTPQKRLWDMAAAARLDNPRNRSSAIFAWLRRNPKPSHTVSAHTATLTEARQEAQRYFERLADTTTILNSDRVSYTNRKGNRQPKGHLVRQVRDFNLSPVGRTARQ